MMGAGLGMGPPPPPGMLSDITAPPARPSSKLSKLKNIGSMMKARSKARAKARHLGAHPHLAKGY